MTPEQQRAVAIARARRRRTEAEQNINPAPAVSGAQPAILPPTEASPNAASYVQPAPPPGMVFDPATNRMIDMQAEAEGRRREGGFMQGLSDLAGQFVSGAPFLGSYLDEAAGVAGGAIGQDPTLTQERARAQLQTYQAENPGTAATAQIAGGITGAVGMGAAALPVISRLAPASLAGQAVTAAAIGTPVGAMEGAITGYGRGTDDASRMDEARTGSLVGGALALGLAGSAPFLGAGIRSAGGRLLDLLGPVRAKDLGIGRPAANILTRAMEADGSFDGAGAANLARAGDDAMLADTGPNARAILDTAIQRSGPGGALARELVQARAGRANNTITAALDQTLGRPQGVGTMERGIRQSTASARGSAYDAAYNSPIDYAIPAGRDLEDMISNRVPASAISAANALMRAEGNSSKQILADIADDGTVTFRTLPDVRQIDYITRGLKDVADAENGKGKLGGTTTLGNAYTGLARDIRSTLRELVPAYGEALDTAAEPIAARQALRFGEELLSRGNTRDDVALKLAGMSEAEKAQARAGVRAYIDETLAGVQRAMTDGNMDAREAIRAARELSSRANREKMTALLGEEQSGRLFSEMDRATMALDLRAAVADNTKTFARQSMDRIVSDQADGGMMGALKRGKPLNAAQRFIQELTGETPEAVTARGDAIYEDLVRLLTQPRGPAAAQALSGLRTISKTTPEREELARALARGGALAVAAPAYSGGSYAGSRF